MKLDNIGFYTLSDSRAKQVCSKSPLWRNEVIITSLCNFNCPYCRGTDINGLQGHMQLSEIKNIIDFFAKEKIQNIRFSGGEPTIHPDIKEIIRYTKEKCDEIKHIAISTNGYSSFDLYQELYNLGVNDFSVSLDACCSSVGDLMSGGIKGSWIKVVENIKKLSNLTYTTVGIVFDKQNSEEMKSTIEFASSLGVSDIRVISAAQWNDFSIFENLELSKSLLDKHPILKYRINNFKNKRNVRGIKETDYNKCPLLLDDMIVKGNYHYPCVIKMREGCQPIGCMTDKTIRQDRENYFNKTNVFNDHICQKNCLDVCIDYNNRWFKFNKDK